MKNYGQISGLIFTIFVFCVFAIQICFLKTTCSISPSLNTLETTKFLPPITEGRVASRPNLRISHDILIAGLNNLFYGMTSFGFQDLENSPYFRINPFGTRNLGNKQTVAQMVNVPTLIAFPVVALSPILVLTLLWFKTTWQRLFIITAISSALLGWYPPIHTIFFEFVSTFLDWPWYYFLFDTKLQLYDFMAVGVTALMVTYISLKQTKRWWEIVLITILGQMTIEYLGMVFGIGLAISEFLKNDTIDFKNRIIIAAKPCLLVAIVTILIAATNAFIFYFILENIIRGNCYLGSCFDTNFQSFAQIKIIIAAAIIMLYPPTLIGALLGILFTIFSRDLLDNTSTRLNLSAAFGIWVGLAIAALIGLFTVPYPSEMGRQFLPISIVTLLTTLQLFRLITFKLLRKMA